MQNQQDYFPIGRKGWFIHEEFFIYKKLIRLKSMKIFILNKRLLRAQDTMLSLQSKRTHNDIDAMRQ